MVKYVFLALHAILLSLVAVLVNKRVSEPYMLLSSFGNVFWPRKDEIFHIPQAQRYCEGDYRSWDPKLTTPPGLYLISNVIIILPFLNCSTSILRAINLGFSLGLYLVIWRILARLHPYQNDYIRSFNAFTLSLFPVGWFYNFLYYTDSGSTFFVLLAYLMAIEKKIKTSALMATTSIFFRQTNVIWLLFILGVSIVNVLSDTEKNQKSDGNKRLLIVKAINIDSLEQAFQQIANLVRLALQNVIFLLKSFFPFLISLIGFAIFLKWNGGVVLEYLSSSRKRQIPIDPRLRDSYKNPMGFIRLHIRQPTTSSSTNTAPGAQRLVIEFLLYTCVNFVTCFLFLWRPFVWKQEEGKLQRFIW
ncbi:9781_t:CDS:2 [Ambispora leptoticha]|uniref:Dol-P-Glc:Glc(2)Man(9)GlcNAc(2)-PP-Dol alpha-1,2-glucosyltransferase n=1 Tax=Ambispora leptoticha TaxID=144679 RepID=A0A9N8Z9A7_9GLOM|nr:9781_t:CDS:2 [Ambispora leptoticha]